LEVANSSEEWNSKDTFHFYEDERSLSSSIEFEPLLVGPEYVVLNHNQDTTLSFHDKSLEMEKLLAKEICEAPTLESKEKDSTYEHGSFSLEIPQGPCSFNTTPESSTSSA
jgi:hypothetical protein